MHQKTDSGDSVFTTLGLATLKSTLCLAVLLLVAISAIAQTSRGTVTGTVLDPTGAVIAGARVTLTGVETGVRLSTNSNDAGVYRFDAVDLGTYDLTVSLSGFSTYLSTHIGVEANRATTIDPTLEVGAAETRIEVSGEASEILIKDSPLRGGNFQPGEVRNLPLISQNPLSLARALPGATEAAGSYVWGNAGSGPNGNGGGFSINGQRPRGNNYLLDGTENNDVFLNGEEQVFRIADAVEEVSVQTGNFGLEFGRAGGGVFNVVTKSGTNSLHGTLLWRYQSQRFDSVSNLDKLNGISQSVFSHNVFGFTAGGPVRKNKTFFFAGFQGDTNHSTANLPVLIPTADAVTRLLSLFPNNPRLDLYLSALGSPRGSGNPFSVPLALILKPAWIGDRCYSPLPRMCCRESTMALNGWLEWTTTHPKDTASPGDTPPIPGTSGQWTLLSRDSLRRIRWVTTIFFSPTATRSAPATPTSFASPMAGPM